MTLCIRCIASGRVQGVFFRAATRKKATELELHGSVSNLPDGSVEVVAYGEPERLQDLQEWLWQGSPAAQVGNVQCAESKQDLSDFAGDMTF